MKFSKSALLLAATVVFAAATVARAQDHTAPERTPRQPKTSTVRLGDKAIVIPDPEGYEEGTAQFPRIKDLFTAIEAPGNDLLLAHLPASDCTALRRGEQLFLSRYTKVSVLRAAREIAVSDSDMAETIAEFRKNGAKLLEPDGPLMNEVMRNAEKGLTKLESREIGLDVNETQNLGEFDVRPEVYSVILLMMIKVESDGTQVVKPTLSSLTFLKVRQRVVYLNVYHKLSSMSAVKTELKPAMKDMTQFAKKWVDDILAANRETR